MSRARGLVLAVASLAGCAAPVAPRSADAAADARAFVAARDRLAALRAAVAGERTQKVRLELSAPYLPSKIAARGAIALAPPDRLRMIMIGPGGTTAMDLWQEGPRFRFAIPALSRVVRGDASTPARERRGLPVDFLRWWMLDALSGELVAARAQGDDLEILLREPARVTEAVLRKDGSVTAHRTWLGVRPDGTLDRFEEEWVTATPAKARGEHGEVPPAGCMDATYRQRTIELEVVATCESERTGISAAALADPDAATGPEAPAPGGGS